MHDRVDHTREWTAKGEELFGKDRLRWRFVCPSCGFEASVEDWKEAGATKGEVAFSCIGRRLEKCNDAFKGNGGPCNYAGGGLFRINPVQIDGHEEGIFDFAGKPFTGGQESG